METAIQKKKKQYVPSQKPTYVRQGDDLPLQLRRLMLKIDIFNVPGVLEEMKRVDEKILVFSFGNDELRLLANAGIIRRMWGVMYGIQYRRANEIIDLVLKKHKRNSRSDVLLLRILKNKNNVKVLSRLVHGDSPDQIFKRLRMEPSVMKNCFQSLNRTQLLHYNADKDHCIVHGNYIKDLLE